MFRLIIISGIWYSDQDCIQNFQGCPVTAYLKNLHTYFHLTTLHASVLMLIYICHQFLQYFILYQLFSLAFKCNLNTGYSVRFFNGHMLLLNVLDSILEQSSDIQHGI